MRTLNELNLNELSSLKSIVSDRIEDFAKSLTSYRHMSGDMSLARITPNEKQILDTRTNFVKLYDKIVKLIDDKIIEYCKNEKII